MEKKKRSSDIIDVSTLIQQYKAKWYLFAISVVVCCSIALFWAKTHRPVYEVTANVLIDTGDNDPMASLSMGGLFGATNYVDDEIFILSSHSLYCDVAKELGLDRVRIFKPGFMQKVTMVKDYPLDILVPPQFADTAKVSISFAIKVNDEGLAKVKVIGPNNTKLAKIKDAKLPLEIKTIYGKFVLTKTKDYVAGEPYKALFVVKGYDGAAEDLDENISSYIVNKRTHVIQLTYPTDDSEFGKTLLNTVLAKYDERVIEQKNKQSTNTLRFLDRRIREISGDLAGIEGNLQQFKENNRIIEYHADAEYNLTMKGELSKKLVEAESQLEVARMARDFLASPENEYSLIPFSSTDEASIGINTLVNSYNNIVVRRMQLLTGAKPDNVQVKNLEKQLDAMRGNIAVSLAKNYENTLAVVKELRGKIDQTQSSLSDLPGHERQLGDMRRDQRVKQSLYVFLLEKREETAVMLANAVSKGVVVDPAFVPSDPVSMSTKKLLAIAFVLGLILPIIFLYTRKLLRGKPETRAEIEGQIHPTVLGEISTSRSGKTLVVTPNSTSSTVELFKLVRTNLQFILKGEGHKVIMVTSSQSGEGKSFISINVASALALQGKKVLLVGLDIRKPMLSSYLDLPADHPGLTNYLLRPEIGFRDVIQKVKEVSGFDVVVAGIIPPNPAELLLEPRLKDFFEEARGNYDYVIVDSAPVGMVSDSLSVAEFADTTVYVTRLGVTRFRDLQLINSLYEEGRLPKMNVIVNGTSAVQGYGYGYGYGSVEDHGKHSPTRKKGLFGKIKGMFR